jgi:hypothetical protein
MRQVLALAGAATLTAALLGACGGGGAESEEVGARKAACDNAPDFAFRSPSQAPAPAPTVGKAAVSAALRSPSQAPYLVAHRPTALPPEPVEELLPKARFVVEARVARVLYRGETPERDTDENVAEPLPPERCQVVELEVTRRVTGADPGTSIQVVKPLAPYLLNAGQSTSGMAFLVQSADPYPIIVGRYGPYPVTEVEAALTARR